jgi:hypothetical protein
MKARLERTGDGPAWVTGGDDREILAVICT